MKEFFSDKILLNSIAAEKIYSAVRDLPIIDYHCHLNEKEIIEDKKYENIGELWLSSDHYKWRAMRLCGIDEFYITGGADYREKFFKYAEIMPMLCGNPLYYWSQMELKYIFGINTPLNKESAREIYSEAQETLKTLSVRTLLKKFKVEYIATTDDPMSELSAHGVIDGITVAPTFRPDRCFAEKVDKATLEKRLDYFILKGCKIADHGFDNVADNTKDLEWLIEQCFKKDIVLQLHFGTFRNINSTAYKNIGKDSGFDVMRSYVDADKIAYLLNKMNTELGGLPKIILYSLNENAVKSLCAISGAFKNVYIGAAWWFNDTLQGIKRQLESVSEYAVLGTNFGMLTDSRSFASYLRFDFFRRILSDFIGEKVEKGEYDESSAVFLAEKISYFNIKELIKI